MKGSKGQFQTKIAAEIRLNALHGSGSTILMPGFDCDSTVTPAEPHRANELGEGHPIRGIRVSERFGIVPLAALAPTYMGKEAVLTGTRVASQRALSGLKFQLPGKRASTARALRQVFTSHWLLFVWIDPLAIGL